MWFTRVSIANPVMAVMVMLAFVVLGLFSYQRLAVDQFPNIDFPFVTISTRLVGAAPEEIETEVTEKIEEAVNTISGIDQLISVSAEGVSVVTVQFVLEKDGDVAAQEVRDRVNAVLADLPRDADPPVIEKIDPDATPVLSVVLSGPAPIRDLTESIYRYPVEVGIWQTLGDAYMRANRLKEALEAYNKAEELIR